MLKVRMLNSVDVRELSPGQRVQFSKTEKSDIMGKQNYK